MAFQQSPGVLVTEKDLTNIVPSVATSTGAFAGAFNWGPVLDPIQITSENELVSKFGRPTTDTAQSFFTAANFLAYSNNLLVCRAATADQANAVETLDGGLGAVINNETDYDSNFSDGSHDEFGKWAARYPGALGNSITVAFADSATYGKGPIVFDGDTALVVGQKYEIVTLGDSDFTTVGASDHDGAYPNGKIGDTFIADGTDAGGGGDPSGGTFRIAAWDYNGLFDTAPDTSTYAEGIGGSNDELHIIVIDSLGRWTGTPGTIIEKFPYCSKAIDAKAADGTSQYYVNVVNNTSKYIYWISGPADGDLVGTITVDPVLTNSQWGKAAEGRTFASLKQVTSFPIALQGGADSSASPTTGEVLAAWAIFQDLERFDISLLPLGAVNPGLAEQIIAAVADTRKDCVAFVSPCASADPDVANGTVITGNSIKEDTVAFRTDDPFNVNSSYAFCDSGWKKQYDRYNDVYRWVPLNGDIAGLCARTDDTNDPWFSPAGLNRGLIKNAAKLSFNPNKAQRDDLYKVGINSVVSFPGEGVLLYGDKTLLSKPSAFDRINVRRLFIVLEKAIAKASKYMLFEFNNSFTRSQFKSMVEPFLRDVQGRSGIYDFRVICDESNNTGEVIDRNEFVGDIYIKPARSINFITLNFIAARTSISFTEIGA